MPTITGVIVAEWNASLKYYSYAFNHLGKKVYEDENMFERNIPYNSIEIS